MKAKIHGSACIMAFIAIVLSFSNARAEDPAVKAGGKVTRTGHLEGGLMAIGGETTGWQLTYEMGKGKAALEVDMKAIKDAESFDGKKVTISGTIISKEYVERGAIKILKAETVVAAAKDDK